MTDADCRECRVGRKQALELTMGWHCLTHGVVRLEDPDPLASIPPEAREAIAAWLEDPEDPSIPTEYAMDDAGALAVPPIPRSSATGSRGCVTSGCASARSSCGSTGATAG